MIEYCVLKDNRKIGICKDDIQCLLYGEDYRVLEEFSDFKENEKYIKVEKEYIEHTFKYFKSVLKKDDKFISFYDSSFVYSVGEWAIAKNIDDKFGGIYVSSKEYIKNSCYFKPGESALLEVEYDLNNLRHIDAEGNACFYKIFIKSIAEV